MDETFSGLALETLGGNCTWTSKGGVTVSAADLDPTQFEALRAQLASGKTLGQALDAVGIEHE